MKKYIIVAVVLIFAIGLFAGCGKDKIDNLDDESVDMFDVIKSDGEGNVFTRVVDKETNAKLESIDFYLVSGTYSRNVVQEEQEMLEMFALEKDSFLRIAENDLEREVFAYNYKTDNFTYLYYFEDELMSKTVIDMTTGAVLEDDAEYASMLTEDAQQLKDYFNALIEMADISVADLEGQ